jgi:uncharacterized protein YjeT (DUF2065 family)
VICVVVEGLLPSSSARQARAYSAKRATAALSPKTARPVKPVPIPRKVLPGASRTVAIAVTSEAALRLLGMASIARCAASSALRASAIETNGSA